MAVVRAVQGRLWCLERHLIVLEEHHFVFQGRLVELDQRLGNLVAFEGHQEHPGGLQELLHLGGATGY